MREVFHEIVRTRDIGQSTVLKLMHIMTEKGTVVRPQVYRATRSRWQLEENLLRNLLDRAFNDSPGNVVLQAWKTEKATPEERRRTRDLLDRLEKNES